MAAGGNDDILMAVQLVGHRRGLRAGGKGIFPEDRTGSAVEGAEVAVDAGGDEDQVARGHDSPAKIERAPFFGVGVYVRGHLITQGNLPALRTGPKVDPYDRTPWRPRLHEEAIRSGLEK